MATTRDGPICAVILDGEGGGREIGWDEIDAWTAEKGHLWVHLDWAAAGSAEWLAANVPQSEMVEALLADETRPRSVPHGDHLLVTLRGVNLNPGQDPEDMVSLRAWIGPERTITTRHRRIMAVQDARDRFARGRGPKGPGEMLVFIADRLVERMGPTLDELADAVDELEATVLEDEKPAVGVRLEGPELRRRLAEVRRQVIALRRYLAPQREAMTRLQMEDVDWLGPRNKVMLREVADHITRYVEDLEALRDRGTVVQDELRNRLSEDMNRTMYVLTVVAAVLLPLSLITGLLGINVDGMPGAKDAPSAFWIVVAGLALIGVLQAWLFRRLGWI